MIARTIGVAIDARAAARADNPRERALAARWIAANVLAARGVRPTAGDVRGLLAGEAPRRGRVVEIRAKSLVEALAALAAEPVLFDAKTLPLRWRLALRALGIPVVDRPVPAVLASGASVATLVA